MKMRISIGLIAALAWTLGAASPGSAATEELVVVANGEAVGHVRADQQGDRISVDYLVDNNGRGPRHTEAIRLGPDGIPIEYVVQGRSLMGGPVAESYRWENGRAV